MIPINKPWIGEEEKQEVLKVLEENSLTSPARDGGKRVQEFESALRDFLNIKHVIAVNSGTAALHAALLAADVKPGDEVLLPSFTFVATANSIIAVGAKPVFVDINKKDYTIDTNDLKNKISKKSKAIIPVHLYGHPIDFDEIQKIAEQNSLTIIEDACQSLGSIYKQKQTGTLGSMGCFSTYASKVLTSGEGGAIVTNNDELYDKLKMIRNHGMVEGYDTRVFGLNLRLPELSAALAKVQMKKLTTILDLRRKNAELLYSKIRSLDNIDNLLILPEETYDKKFNWYLYTVGFLKETLRNKIKEKLLKLGIGATVYYDPPVHKTPYYKNLSSTNLVNTDWASDNVLSFPVHPMVNEDNLDSIISVLRDTI